MAYGNCMFTGEAVNRTKLREECKAHCGKEISISESQSCRTSLRSHFDDSRRYQSLKERLKAYYANPTKAPSPVPNLCIWVAFRDEEKCQNCIDLQIEPKLAKLSRATAFLWTSQSGVVDCIDQDSDEQTENLRNSATNRDQASDFDLNIKLVQEEHALSPINPTNTPGIINVVTVIHLKEKAEIDMLECVYAFAYMRKCC
uniref:AlNc14C114G6477 protein n=1 Tax=Albugo laibachii Nc14 TaxID=890382 RepID=F0WIU2_9STRA|nr:AlNc14C114G6477 [Albugo laibachii Nc14]|eukprot:CCA21186.1 AlNc14C114G6477 [Albugo laibachii Nc14]